MGTNASFWARKPGYCGTSEDGDCRGRHASGGGFLQLLRRVGASVGDRRDVVLRVSVERERDTSAGAERNAAAPGGRFPGLGWMLTQELWEAPGPKWPKMFWDECMRSARPDEGTAMHLVGDELDGDLSEEGRVTVVPLQESRVASSARGRKRRLFEARPRLLGVGAVPRLCVLAHVEGGVPQVFYLSHDKATGERRDCRVSRGLLQPITTRTWAMGSHRNGMKRTSYKG